MPLKDIASWNGHNLENSISSCSSCSSCSASQPGEKTESQPESSSCTATAQELLENPSSCAASCTADSSSSL